LVYTIDQLGDHPHLSAVNMFHVREHPTEGKIRYARPAVRFSETPASVRHLAPRLGQHTKDVLHTLGYSLAQIEQLLADGIIRSTDDYSHEKKDSDQYD